MMYQEYEQASRLLIQNALRSPFAKIPLKYEKEYLNYEKNHRFNYLLRINIVAQLAYALYSIADWLILSDIGLLAVICKSIYTALAMTATFLIYKFSNRPEHFDLVLPISIVGASALWFYLVSLSSNPNTATYIYASCVFILLANLCVHIRFVPALIVSAIISTISYFSAYHILHGLKEQYLIYLLSYNPVLIFSLIISWNLTYKSRRIFLHHKLNGLNRDALEHIAHTDMLTGINNRRYFELCAKQLLHHPSPKNFPMALLIFDVDYFKRINDNYGHDLGDEVLKKIASVSKRVLRKNDLFARFGGEEFIILLPETEKEDACKIAERLRVEIEKSPVYVSKNRPIYFTVSTGFTIIDRPTDNLSAVIKKADNSLYRAKSMGRNLVVLDGIALT